MRIISQGGTIDTNYDRLTIEVVGCHIGGYDVGGTTFTLAEYSTAERAAEEMERLHLVYIRTNKQTTKTGLTFHENYPKVFKFQPDEG